MGDITSIQELYQSRYADEVFVDVLPEGSHPETRSVRGSNMCRVSLHRPQNGDKLVVLSVIDNLIKGAAGQAVHNMNIMCGLDETVGLQSIALLP
jgi:N-acetyl-gamma-glutamyl-phosphate reductase